MSKPIEIKFSYSKELALKASKLYYDYDMRHSRKRYVGWIFVALLQFGVVGALKHDAFGFLYLSTFLVIYWYYGRWFVRKLMIQKYYKDEEIEDTTFFLKDDGLHYADTLIDWDNIIKAVKFDDGILLQTSTNSLFFEKSAFITKHGVKNFLNSMREKGKL